MKLTEKQYQELFELIKKYIESIEKIEYNLGYKLRGKK